MLIRERHESAKAYVKRLLHAQGTIHAYQLAYDVKRDDGVPAPVSPSELEHVIADLRADWWLIETVERDAAGYTTYRLISAPPRHKNGRQELTEAQRNEATHWMCRECREVPRQPPKVLLAGLAQGRCWNCKKAKAYFVHR